ITLGICVFIGLYIADRAMGKEDRPRGALISWFFVLYFGGRLFTEHYKEFEAVGPGSLITMGPWLSFPGLLLGISGLFHSIKRREPVGWIEPGDEVEDEEDDEAEADETASPATDDGDDDDGDDDDGDDDEPNDDDSAGDPDVESEFEDGKLKKRRDP